MATLQIRKKSNYTWLHIDSDLGEFILSQFYFSEDGTKFQIVEQGQSKRRIYDVSTILVYDDVTGSGSESFATITELSLRLEELFYPAFNFASISPFDPTASHYKGKYNSATITLVDGVGNNGDYWQATDNETVNFGSEDISLKNRDWIHYNGYDGVWEKWINNSQTTSGASILATLLAGLSATAGTFTSSNTILEAFGNVKYLIDNIATTYQTIITDASWGSFINGLTSKTTPVDADYIGLMDSAASNVFKKLSWANLKSTLKTYFDTFYTMSFKVASNADSTAVTGTTATVLAVGSQLIPANTFATNTFLKLIIRARRTVSVSGNTSVLPYLSPNSGITLVTDPTLVALNQLLIIGTNSVAQCKSEIFIKNGTNLTELVNYTNTNDDIVGTDLRTRTTINWGVDQYLYIFVQNNQTTTSTIVSGFKLSREQ